MATQNERVNPKGKIKEASVQAYLEISEIRDNILVLKDGSFRAVLMVSSVNFDLKAPEEQEAIIYNYQDFLNSLNFPIQILIRSKKLDLDNYIYSLTKKYKEENNLFIKSQIEQYLTFINGLLEVSDIMDKKFYVVVPFYPSGLEEGIKKMGFMQKIQNSINPTWSQGKKQEEFEANKSQLLERLNLIMSGLGNFGLRAIQLSTLDLIELFYEIYNLETSQREKLIEVDALTSDIVE